MNLEKYVYEYLFATILLTIIYAIMKCHYNVKMFDKFVYIENTSSKLTADAVIKYMVFHVFGYMIIGYIFTNQHFTSNLLQTIFIECLLASIKNCKPSELYKEDVLFTAFSSISIGMFSYFIGGIIRNYIHE